MAEQTAVTRDEIQERLTEAFVEFGADRDAIKPDATFEDLDIDSLDLVEVAQIVEDEWGVQIKGEDLEGIKTVGQALDLVESRVSS
jgi:acyl carrier protein